MAQKENTGNGGSHGVVVWEANTGGRSGDAFDQVYVTRDSSVTFYEEDNTEFFSYKVRADLSGDWAACMWVPESAPVCAGRVEIRLDSLPASQWLTLLHLNTNGGQGPTIWVNGATGGLQLSDTIILDATADNVVPVGQWFRIEWEMYTVNPDGYYIIKVYADRTSTSPIATLQNTRTWHDPGNTLMVWFGQSVNTTAGEGYRFAHPYISDQSMPGPYTGPGPTPLGEPGINDAFADALPINIATDGDSYLSDPVEFMGNTLEPGEPEGFGHKSAWWRYIPSSDGVIIADLNGSQPYNDPDTRMQLLTADSVDNWNILVDNDDNPPYVQSAINWVVEAGTTYYLRAASYSDYDDGISRSYVLYVTGPAADSGPAPNPSIKRSPPPARVAISAPVPDVTNLPIEIEAPPVTALVREITPVVIRGLPPAAALVWSNNANSNTPGQVVTVANSALSGDPFQEVENQFNTAAPTYETAPGNRVAFLLQPGVSYLKWQFTGYDPTPTIGGRAYFYLPDGAAAYFMGQIQRANGSAVCLAWTKDDNSLFFFEQGGGAPVFGNTVQMHTGVIPTGQWHRWDFSFNFNINGPVGSYQVQWFTDPESTTPAYDLNGYRQWIGAGEGVTEVWWGPSPTYHDNLTINGAGLLPGPFTSDQLVDAAVADVGVAAEAPTVDYADQPPPEPVVLDVPLARVDVHTLVPALTGADATIPAPAALVFAGAPAPTVVYTTGLTAPVAQAQVDPRPLTLIDATVMPIYPPANTVSPSLTPRFKVAVKTDDPTARVEVQYASTITFTDPVTLTAEVPYGLTNALVALKGGAPLINNVAYVWRARVINAFDQTAWSDPSPFTISALDGNAVAGGTWTVDTDHIPDPFLWWTVPDRGKPGDVVAAVGTSFGKHTATVSISGVVTPGDLYGVAASNEAYTATRRISRNDDDVDPGHQRVDFTVPLVGPPAGPVYVDGS